MAISPANIQRGLKFLRRTRLRYTTLPETIGTITKASDTFVSSVKPLLSKEKVLTEYCANNNLPVENVLKKFDELEKLTDKHSIERILKLTEEGKIKLSEKPKVMLKKKMFSFSFDKEGDIITKSDKSLFELLEPIMQGDSFRSSQDMADLLKKLLTFEEQGKIPAGSITRIMELDRNACQQEISGDINTIIKSLEKSELNLKNINEALVLFQENLPISLVTKHSLSELNTSELKQLREILAAKGTNRKASDGERLQQYRDAICKLDTPILPKSRESRSKLLTEISKKLTALVKVNTVPNITSEKFLASFDEIANGLKKAKPIAELKEAGGISQKYSRDSFKSTITDMTKHLPVEERATVLNKFGLEMHGNLMTGFPVYNTELKGLSELELKINKEINKFLNENEVVLPKGFEEYKAPLEEICEAFPEFRFAIETKQHSTQNYKLAEHMLSVFKSNVENPLYKNLNESDRKVLGIATLLHDINKTEMIIDKMHPEKSAKSVNAIVQRMTGLTVGEKDRIINLVENHHWLERISSGENYDKKIVEDLALKFRRGRDFEMAKIFAESDLKGVNNQFFIYYGDKINSPMSKEIENLVSQIQANSSHLIYTSDITLEKAIQMGAKKQMLGTGSEVTENYVIKAKDLGLDKESFLYHAPATDDAFIMAQSGFGYGNEGVFSCSLGKNGEVASFQGRKEFWGFRQPEKGNILIAIPANGNTGAGKGYMFQRILLDVKKENYFTYKLKNIYSQLSGKDINNEQYAQLYKECSSLNLDKIAKNKKVIEILGGEKEAGHFATALKDVQNEFIMSTNKSQEVSEIVAQDLEPAFIGTKRNANDISYTVRKLHPLIVEFEDVI